MQDCGDGHLTSSVFEYALLGVDHLAIWIAITLSAGFVSQAVPGPRFMGLFGDFLVGVIGAFVVGYLFKGPLNLNATLWLNLGQDLDCETSVWLDLLIVAFIGAFVVRLLLMPFAPKKKPG